MPCPPYNASAGNLLIVTSTTRPTGLDLVIGRRIFEGDTGRELLWDGTGWVIMSEPDQTFTPTLTGMAIGTGGSAQNTMHYHRGDGYLEFEWQLIFGTSGQTFPTTPGFSLPVALAQNEIMVPATYVDAGVQRYSGYAQTSSATVMALTTNAAIPLGITTTTPFTWGANDSMTVRARYRMTTRYS